MNDEEEHRRWHRNFVAIGFALAFGGGYFFGSILTAVGLPPGLHGPVLMIMAAGLFFYLHHDRKTGGSDETER